VPPQQQQQQQQQHFFVVLMLLLFPVLFSWISSFHASLRRNKISIVYFHGTRKRCWKRGKSPTYEITITPSQHTWARVFNPFKLWTTFVVSSLSTLIGVVPTLRNLKAYQNKNIFLLWVYSKLLMKQYWIPISNKLFKFQCNDRYTI